jgi:hypothetical protein
MAEIAQRINNYRNFNSVMRPLRVYLEGEPRYCWRTLKALKVLEFCVCRGPGLAETWARMNSDIIWVLRDYEGYDESGRDVGIQGI